MLLNPGRLATIVAALSCLGPPAAVGFTGLGMPPVAAAATVLLLAASAWRLLPVSPLPLEEARRHPWLAAAWVLLLLAGSYQATRASLFAYDPALIQHSAMPGDRFRVEHCCLSAYAEAARFAAEGRPIYDVEAYLPGGQRRRIGPFTVDPFHYPPPFLFLPSAVRLAAPDFLATRRVWFGLQALTVCGAMVFAGWWIGGRRGRDLALLTPLVWAAPYLPLALQTGNFQMTAVAIAAVGCLLAASSRPVAGAALVAAAASAKIFPAVLALHLLAWARVRVAVALGSTALALVVISAATYGVEAWRDFVFGELPRMLSGASFPQILSPSNAAVNLSIYGLTAKLRLAGVTALDHEAGRMLSRVVFLLLAALAAWLGWRARRHLPAASDDRARAGLVAMWLAILNVAAFLSPFVGVSYGAFGTAWLGLLMIARAPSRRSRALAVAGWGVVTICLVVLAPSPRPGVTPDARLLAVTLAGQITALTLNAWAMAAWVAATRPGRAPSR